MKVALVQCPAYSVRMPLLGQAYLRSYLENYDIGVEQFDFNIDLYHKSGHDYKKYWDYESEPFWTRNKFDSTWEDYETISEIPFLSDKVFTQWAETVLRSNADLIGFTVYYTSINSSIFLAKKIKQIDRNKKIIFGGPFFIRFLDISGDSVIDMELPIRNILNIIDMIAIGEGEDTLLEVAKRIKNNQNFDHCQGIIINEGGYITTNKLRPLIHDLDSLPFPDFAILKSYNYTEKNFLPIIGNRGCPNRCTFCDFPHLDRYKLRTRKRKNIVEEMKYQIEKHVPQFFHFNDSTINADPRFLFDLCELIISEGLRIRWGASASISPHLSSNLLEKMKHSGCEYLSLGIESASPRVIQDMGKNFTIKDVKQNILDCYRAGISVATNWIVGFPTETADDFQKTLQFIKENREYLFSIDVASCTLKPHTEIYDKADKYGIEINYIYDWATKNGLNTYEERLRRLKLLLETNSANLGQERIGGYHRTSALSNLKEEMIESESVNMINENERIVVMKHKAVEFSFGQGMGKIIFKGVDLTKGNGLCSSFSYNGECFLSKDASWVIRKERDNKIIATSSWSKIAVTQTWEFEINNNFIFWNLKLKTNDHHVEIKNLELRIILPGDYASWFSLNENGIMQIPLKKPQGVSLKDCSQNCVGVRKSHRGETRFILFAMPADTLGLTPFIVYTVDSVTLMFSAQQIPNAYKEEYDLKGTILVSDREKNIIVYTEELKSKHSELKVNERQRVTVKLGPLEFFFDQGRGRIFYNENELTKNFGFYTSIFSYGTWADSLRAEWGVEKTGNKLIASGNYIFSSFKQKWEIEMVAPTLIKVDITMVVEKPLRLSYQDTNIMLNEIYGGWKVNDRAGSLSKGFTKDWREEIRFANDEFPALYSRKYLYKGRFPSIRIKSQSFASDKLNYVAIHSTSDELKSRIIVCRRDFSIKEYKLEPGAYSYFSGYIEIKKHC